MDRKGHELNHLVAGFLGRPAAAFGMGLLFVGEIHGWSAGISLANGAAEMYWKSTEKVMYILQVRRIPYLNRYVFLLKLNSTEKPQLVKRGPW